MANDNPNEMIQKAMLAAGAHAELMWMFHQNFLRVGFNEKQATYFCGKITSSLFDTIGREANHDD